MNNSDYKLFHWIGGKTWLSKTLNMRIEKILEENKFFLLTIWWIKVFYMDKLVSSE